MRYLAGAIALLLVVASTPGRARDARDAFPGGGQEAADRHDGDIVYPEDFCLDRQQCPVDMTGPIRKAIAMATSTGRPLRIDKVYVVSSLVVDGALRLQGTGSLRGNATKPTPAVLEIENGNIDVDGDISISAEYNPNYSAGLYWHHNAQYSFVRNLSVQAARVCWQVGSASDGSALMSEVTIFGGATYGCPIAARFVGTETYVTVIGQIWSSDDFGVPPSRTREWTALPHRGLVAIGASVNIIGGELIMTGTVDGYLVENQPLAGAKGEGTVWGHVQLRDAVTETASPLAIATNPRRLAIASTYGVRGWLKFLGCSGYHSQDSAPFITTSADFDGEVVVNDSNFWHNGSTRHNANISAGSPLTEVYVDDHGFGPGFQGPLAGTIGGSIHFSKRPVLAVNGLRGQTTQSDNTAVLHFQSVDKTGDLARFSAYYDASSGVFTVPPGGLKDVSIRASAQIATNAPVVIAVSNSATSTSSVVAIGGAMRSADGETANVTWSASSLPAGQRIKILIKTAAQPATAAGPESGNQLIIEASN